MVSQDVILKENIVLMHVVADTLDRCEIPIIGQIASRILDDE